MEDKEIQTLNFREKQYDAKSLSNDAVEAVNILLEVQSEIAALRKKITVLTAAEVQLSDTLEGILPEPIKPMNEVLQDEEGQEFGGYAS